MKRGAAGAADGVPRIIGSSSRMASPHLGGEAEVSSRPPTVEEPIPPPVEGTATSEGAAEVDGDQVPVEEEVVITGASKGKAKVVEAGIATRLRAKRKGDLPPRTPARKKKATKEPAAAQNVEEEPEMMSYASYSTTLSHQGYDVFLSFRGVDTRTHFVSHLYKDLTRNDIRTYKDDKTLERGNFIAPELLAAIENSRFAVVVLSNNFATSKWCLVEIAKVVHCLEQGTLIVIPVFYHVSPSDVSHQSGCFEQGFVNHEANPEITPQKVETWRAAFAKLGKIAGFHVTEQSDEAEVISEIVKRIKKDQAQHALPIDLDKGLVGIKSRADEVKRILRMDSSEVLFIGICGMSGIGKTTLAEAVYKEIRYKFERSSFIENIKDISKQNGSTDFRKFQQKLLCELLKDESIRVQYVNDGRTLLGTKLRGLKVMIVLDDVNHADQLTYLAGGREWFGPGSRIIVTTTNTGLLNAHKINEIHRCEEMVGDEALSLFCQSAFEQAHPAHGYEKLSDDVVKLAGGLPLALRTYGKLFCGRDENNWKDMIRKLEEYPDKEVLGRLEVVYDRLESFQQKTFMYIACFLKGRSIDLVKDILKNIGLYPECGIPDLINKFLITINDEDNVWMHDLLQKMCWEILGKESHRNVGHLVAIKHRQEILDILSSAPKETQTVEIINQDPYKVDVDDGPIDPTCFSMMTKLKFLRISKLHFCQELNNLSSDFRILEWYGCSLKSFPSTFEPKHIYELEMCSSQLEALWAKDLDLPNLRSINLSFSKNLTKLPDLTSTSNLVRLNLEGCIKLTELHESVLLLKTLLYMNLKGCTSLQSLGRSIMEMEALETLHLSGCSNLEYIPEFGENMKRLEHLYVDGTSIKKLPDNLGELGNLKTLEAGGTYIVELPSSIHRLKKLRFLHVNCCRLSLKTGCFLNTHLDTVLSSSLRELDLSYCSLTEVPDGIRWLYCLITLNLSGNDFVSLPPSICLLSKLRMLCLNDCKRLRTLPKLSLLDEDMDYGPRNRFDYYVSAECTDVSRFRASNNNSFPTVSCVNCHKLSENKRGSYLAERILNNYLQLRTKYWITPKAVFVIFGAGSEIPSRFVQPSSDDLILEGPWVGVAICAVVNVSHPVDGYTEAKYVVTAHIRFGEKYCSIAIPVNFFVLGLENQLVFYWTETDYLQRIASSSQIKNKFSVTFSVEPGDGDLQVTKFGVCFIHKEYIPCLKRHEDSMIAVMKDYKFPYIFSSHYCTFASSLSIGFRSSDWIDHHDHFRKIMADIICDGGKLGSLDVIHDTFKGLLEINQDFFKVLSLCKKELKNQMFVFCYLEISLGVSILYNDFIQSLKDINDDWLSVKLTLETILAKLRVGDFKEILEQYNDLEASQSVGFSDNFIMLFASIYMRGFDTIKYFNSDYGSKPLYRMGKKKSEQLKALAKISSATIAGVFCMMAAFMGDYNVLKQMKDITSYEKTIDVIDSFVKKNSEWFKKDGQYMKTHCNWELEISDFHRNAIVIQELRNKMARSGCLTKENEEMMIIVINKLQQNIEMVSHTIKDMSSQVEKYSDYIKAARKHVKSYSRFSETLRAFLCDNSYLESLS